MRSIFLALLVFTSTYSPGQACPGQPRQIQCPTDPNISTSCRDMYTPPGPLIYANGPYENVQQKNCCGTTVQNVIVYSVAYGCFSAQLRTPESKRNVLALLKLNDLFLLTCTNDFTRYLPQRSDRIQTKAFGIPTSVSFKE